MWSFEESMDFAEFRVPVITHATDCPLINILCNICKLGVPTPLQLLEHVFKDHMTVELTCVHCTPLLVVKHIAEQHKSKCEICGQVVLDMRSHCHSDSDFCTPCALTFGSRPSYRRHMKSKHPTQ